MPGVVYGLLGESGTLHRVPLPCILTLIMFIVYLHAGKITALKNLHVCYVDVPECSCTWAWTFIPLAFFVEKKKKFWI